MVGSMHDPLVKVPIPMIQAPTTSCVSTHGDGDDFIQRDENFAHSVGLGLCLCRCQMGVPPSPILLNHNFATISHGFHNNVPAHDAQERKTSLLSNKGSSKPFPTPILPFAVQVKRSIPMPNKRSFERSCIVRVWMSV